MKNKKSILATDFNKVKKEQELWLEKKAEAESDLSVFN